MLKYKIVLAGAKNIGKSSLIARFCDNSFNENMRATIGVAFKRKKLIIPNEKNSNAIDLTIWDFGGEEKFRILFGNYTVGASAALILYDTTNKDTLSDIDAWVEVIDSNTKEEVVKVIIGSKADLIDEREVTSIDAKKFCSKYDWATDLNIIETSSKTGENVEAAFMNVGREIMSKKLQECLGCGGYFDKKLRVCSLCGKNAAFS